jgi:hypothetical protein
MKVVHILLVVLLVAAMAQLPASKAAGDTAAATSAPELAAAMKEAKITLVSGLNSAETVGMPVSGKFELEAGSLNLSVLTVKAGKFSEVVLDAKTGAIVKTEPITAGRELEAAQKQARALGKGRGSLAKVVTRVEAAHPGSAAVSVLLTIDEGAARADLVLLVGTQLEQVAERF